MTSAGELKVFPKRILKFDHKQDAERSQIFSLWIRSGYGVSIF